MSLRTSLMSAYLGFKIADLVTGLGALFLRSVGGGVASAYALRQSQRLTSGIEQDLKVPVIV